MSDEARDLLTAVGKRLSRPEILCKGALARDGRGKEVCPTSRRAVAWDAIGMAYHVLNIKPSRKIEEVPKGRVDAICQAVATMNLAACRLHRRASIATVGDELGHDAVLETLRLAWKWAATTDSVDR